MTTPARRPPDILMRPTESSRVPPELPIGMIEIDGFGLTPGRIARKNVAPPAQECPPWSTLAYNWYQRLATLASPYDPPLGQSWATQRTPQAPSLPPGCRHGFPFPCLYWVSIKHFLTFVVPTRFYNYDGRRHLQYHAHGLHVLWNVIAPRQTRCSRYFHNIVLSLQTSLTTSFQRESPSEWAGARKELSAPAEPVPEPLPHFCFLVTGSSHLTADVARPQDLILSPEKTWGLFPSLVMPDRTHIRCRSCC